MYPTDIPFNQLKDFYRRSFGLENFKISLQNKFCLIGLIIYLVEKNKASKPDVTYYKVIYALGKPLHTPPEVINGLAILCEDFAQDTPQYDTFGIERDQVIPTIQKLLGKYMPF